MYLGIYALLDHLYGSKKLCNSDDEENKDWRTGVLEGIRGNEVKEWLDRHPEVDKYVILDDDSDFLEDQKPFFVQTNSDDGFSANNYMAAEKILKEKDEEKE